MHKAEQNTSHHYANSHRSECQYRTFGYHLIWWLYALQYRTQKPGEQITHASYHGSDNHWSRGYWVLGPISDASQ